MLLKIALSRGAMETAAAAHQQMEHAWRAAVEIDLNASPEMVAISVRDHGLGIPQEQLDKIFDRFYRVTDLSWRAIPGLGMGLYIVAEIIKRHGGDIVVESEVGKGSIFTVTLPKRRET